MAVFTPTALQSPLLHKYYTDRRSRDENDASPAGILQRLQGLERMTDELKRDNVDLKQKNADLECQVIGLKQKNADHECQVIGLKQEIVGLKQEIVGLKQEVVDLKQSNNNLKQQVRQLTKRGDTLAVQLEQERTTRIMEATNHANTSGRLAKLAAHNDSLQSQLDTMEEMQRYHSMWIHSQVCIALSS